MILKYGDCIFYPCSTQSKERVEQAIVNSDPILLKRLKTCNLQILVVSEETPILDWVTEYPFSKNEVYDIWIQWNSINSYSNIRKNNDLIQNSLIGDRIQIFKNSNSRFVYKINNKDKKNQYLFLLPNTPSVSFPIVELALLCNLSKLQIGNLLLHSAAIIHRDRLFLFGGSSGAGKSTVSNISKDQGDYVLDEDQVRIKIGEGGLITVGAWGYSLKTSNTPLSAIIKLVKDSENELIPIPKNKTAEFLFDRTQEIFGNTKSQEYIFEIFQNVSMIARNIPGYELHFRKSPDFWKVIDAELGLD